MYIYVLIPSEAFYEQKPSVLRTAHLRDEAILLKWIWVILIPEKGKMIGVTSSEIVRTNIYIDTYSIYIYIHIYTYIHIYIYI